MHRLKHIMYVLIDIKFMCNCILATHIHINGEDSINFDNYADITRKVRVVFNAENLITVTYNLEVISLGLDYLMFAAEHYMRFTSEK